MIGRTISHYSILEKLGEGGMGVVYKARDTHLDRFVAIKVLHAEKVADPERKQRFVQEAKAASSLNHPNIITIYDIGQAEGADFISMELDAVQGNQFEALTAAIVGVGEASVQLPTHVIAKPSELPASELLFYSAYDPPKLGRPSS